MGASHTELYVHAAFSVKDQRPLITRALKGRLYQYMSYIFKLQGQSLIAINGMPDHVHLLFRMSATKALADLMRDVKALSSRFVNEENLSKTPFYWENGYVAFSCTHAQVEQLLPLFNKQELYHAQHTFKDEILEMMGELNIHFSESPDLRWLDALYRKSG